MEGKEKEVNNHLILGTRNGLLASTQKKNLSHWKSPKSEVPPSLKKVTMGSYAH